MHMKGQRENRGAPNGPRKYFLYPDKSSAASYLNWTEKIIGFVSMHAQTPALPFSRAYAMDSHTTPVGLYQNFRLRWGGSGMSEEYLRLHSGEGGEQR